MLSRFSTGTRRKTFKGNVLPSCRSISSICRRSRTTFASGEGLNSIKTVPSSWLRRVETRRIPDSGKLLQGRRGARELAIADGPGGATSVTGDSL
uniref:Uncharacterized protein n=1 Tax=Chromera velia CCMP2878 TaxID=1169474 RepID=A0A0G4H975_9ALVE|eukprot:Cvel_25186.t1-p1 / transcript=Cvel_25186.t1 / gene=Cvel_25186 / organism=Chromera_velia_CCMP2878 / gene_product=hypothetical protein / transcript_product=hypothetical protein / location=Cvel_scaffold2819:13101-13382(-) / protein_length=94 / sequence_SO=supercontig / SO=protein_coding / is_pseudo=false